MLSQDHIEFFSKCVQERGPISSRRLKQLGSQQFTDTIFQKRYIAACLNESQGFKMTNSSHQVGSNKNELFLWNAVSQ